MLDVLLQTTDDILGLDETLGENGRKVSKRMENFIFRFNLPPSPALTPQVLLTCRTLVQLVYLANVVSAKPLPLTHLIGTTLQSNDGRSTITAKGFWSIMHYAPVVIRFAKMLDLSLTEFVEVAFLT